MRKVQIGVRVSREDAEFISTLQVEGARSPSDKLRAIIEEARKKAESSQDFGGAFRLMKTEISPIVEQVKRFEHEHGGRSLVLERILEWMPDFYAYCLSVPNVEGRQELAEYEKGVTDKIFHLFEALIHLQLSAHQNSYNLNIIDDHLAPIGRLIEIAHEKMPKREEAER